MANNPSSKKRARQLVKRRAHNTSLRSMVRTSIKKVNAQIEAKDYDAASQAFSAAGSCIDSMVNKGIFTKNKAARTKSRLNEQIKALKG